jgi:hypothetical protein
MHRSTGGLRSSKVKAGMLCSPAELSLTDGPATCTPVPWNGQPRVGVLGPQLEAGGPRGSQVKPNVLCSPAELSLPNGSASCTPV